MSKNFEDERLLLKNIFTFFDFDNDSDILFFMKLFLLYKSCSVILLNNSILLDLDKEDL